MLHLASRADSEGYGKSNRGTDLCN